MSTLAALAPTHQQTSAWQSDVGGVQTYQSERLTVGHHKDSNHPLILAAQIS